MVVYEFDMTNRFLENSVYLDIPLKYLLLAQCHCLVMYALKLILKNFQRTDLEGKYVEHVIVGNVGKEAMKLAATVAVDFYLDRNVEYLLKDETPIQNTYFCQQSARKKTFCKELYSFVMSEKRRQLLQETEEPRERVRRNTTSTPFLIHDAEMQSEILYCTLDPWYNLSHSVQSCQEEMELELLNLINCPM